MLWPLSNRLDFVQLHLELDHRLSDNDADKADLLLLRFALK